MFVSYEPGHIVRLPFWCGPLHVNGCGWIEKKGSAPRHLDLPVHQISIMVPYNSEKYIKHKFNPTYLSRRL